MKLLIQQAQEDGFGNVKENIFLAFNEQEQYLGNGYVYPTINEHQTNETPYLIYLNLDVEPQPQEEEIRQALFDAVIKRAKELRMEKPQLKCRIYAGFEWNEPLMEFYLKNGFKEDYSIFMETDLSEAESASLPESFRVEEFTLETQKDFESFKSIYDEIFVTPLDEGFAQAQEEDTTFRNFYVFDQNQLIGEFSLREEGDCGYVETLFVLKEYRGKGISKKLMGYIHQYFIQHGLKKSMLEVWELNLRAMNLYQSCGYQETQKNNMFPGITV